MGPVTPRAMGHMTNAVNMGTKTSLSICGMILSKNWYTYFSTSTVRMMGMLLDAYLTNWCFQEQLQVQMFPYGSEKPLSGFLQIMGK